MAIQPILQLGHPTLRAKCATVKVFRTDELHGLISDLRDTLHDFKSRNGFGRGIAAPQIDVSQRVIFIHVDQPIPMVNPLIVRRSRRLMTLWDDCFSFPNLLVKVRRNSAIAVRYQDEQGERHTIKASGALSELLQHEIDHLNGILAIDRAINSRYIVFRTEYETWIKNRQPRAAAVRA